MISNTTAVVRKRNRSFLLGCAAIAILILIVSPLDYCYPQPMEYLLKAGFLEKFANFTDWPPQSSLGKSAQQDKDGFFIISVIGKSPFQGALEELYITEKIKHRPVSIRYISRIEEIKDSHILFISESEKDNLDKILAATKCKPILVVSDTRTFGEKGCHINFYITPKGTLHFEINLKKVKASGLHMQLVLLEVAKIID